jgi:hypothetical protein
MLESVPLSNFSVGAGCEQARTCCGDCCCGCLGDRVTHGQLAARGFVGCGAHHCGTGGCFPPPSPLEGKVGPLPELLALLPCCLAALLGGRPAPSRMPLAASEGARCCCVLQVSHLHEGPRPHWHRFVDQRSCSDSVRWSWALLAWVSETGEICAPWWPCRACVSCPA